MIHTENLSKRFQQGSSTIFAVNNVFMDIQEGETVAIVGPSGSGKTTLLSLLAGLERPDQGFVNIDGKRLNDMNEARLTQWRGSHVGFVFQQFHLMPHLTALENVCLPLEINKITDAANKAQQALQRVGLEERVDHLPSQLSGGECQRVAIARAIVMEPKILFADEPSGNLDAETGQKVITLLFDLVLKKQMTMILVTHDLDLAKKCHRILKISGGKLA